MTHGEDLDGATAAIDAVDDPEPSHPELPEAFQLTAQGVTPGRVVTEGAKGVPDAPLQVRVQLTYYLGNGRWDDGPIPAHLAS